MWSEDLHCCPPPHPTTLSVSSLLRLRELFRSATVLAERRPGGSASCWIGVGSMKQTWIYSKLYLFSQCSLDPSRSPGFKVHVLIRFFSPLDLGRALSSGASGASLCMRLPCWDTQVRCWHTQSRIPRDRALHPCRGDEGGSGEMDWASGLHDMD